MPTEICVFNPTSRLIDVTVGAVTGPGTPGTPVVLNNSGFLDPTLIQNTSIGTVDLTATDNIAPTTVYTVPSGASGLYRVYAYLIVKTPAGTSSTLPKVTITWYDQDNGAAQSLDLTLGAVTSNLTTAVQQGSAVVSVAESTTSPVLSSDIKYSTSGYASNAANAMVYGVHIRVCKTY